MTLPKILSLEFEHNVWSWGLISGALQKELDGIYQYQRVDFGNYVKFNMDVPADIVFSQNLTQLKQIKSTGIIVARMGGNRTFDVPKDKRDWYLGQMRKCGAIIATNNYLYNLAKAVNPNTFLIPNGIDLNLWKPVKGRVFNTKKPVVGFIGNVTTQEKSEYKGYPLVKAVCKNYQLTLHEALYKLKQIPHEHMQAKFWDKIDVFIMPTAGEGTSNAILEALAKGVPVITTRCAGYHGETLTDYQNVVFCERTPESVAQKLGEMITHPTMFNRLSINGRKYAEQHHDIHKIVLKYREVFELVLNRQYQPPNDENVTIEDVYKEIKAIKLMLLKLKPRKGKMHR